QLVNSQRFETSDYVCVFLEEGLDPFAPYLNKVRLESQDGTTGFTLASVARSPTHCMNVSGSWSVESNYASDVNCDKEIALIF
ncbi:hypothetical protein PFISCL1PPCAC_7816, partial [Pristionchus fissidentatus]